MNALTEAKQAEVRARTEQTRAAQEVTDANAALAAALQAARNYSPPAGSEDATDKAAALDADVTKARSRQTRAGLALRRAEQSAAEAVERTARLQPHAAALDKLDKALATVKVRDAAVTDVAIGAYLKLAEELLSLRVAVLAATDLYNAIPVDVRAQDLSQPHTAAYWGAVAPERSGLLLLAEAAVSVRLGGVFPNSSEGKARLKAAAGK